MDDRLEICKKMFPIITKNTRLLCHYCDGRNICSYDEEKAHELLRNEEGTKNN
ncbi:TPA: hypothetical protein KRH92_002773 [Clostridioides difficile]|uniref:hypothetical protein n=1 Tax=Clostridioides difficile TaxID=1496 RepID=UPI001028684A|nr:hypothetical protein [Clostridioides difficile]MDV9570541.1 hypothetical protein [Clostridioides difficile]MDV9583844.1 hypothetical protein [Clostridioides difficile]MDV9611220.1 hypothetical protein [Clostridioides difficile]MDV9623025.1 hypothetical protein [Clostridioides difficile]MDV9627990.1 hypothetical protein [Clostridioides difficile]